MANAKVGTFILSFPCLVAFYSLAAGIGCDGGPSIEEVRADSAKVMNALYENTQFEVIRMSVQDGRAIGTVRVNNPTEYNVKDLMVRMDLLSDPNYFKATSSMDGFASYELHTMMLKSWDTKEISFNVELPDFEIKGTPMFTPLEFEQ